MQEYVVMLAIQSDDPRLGPSSLNTIKGTKAMRQAVIDALPGNIISVVALMDPLRARLMMEAMEIADAEMGFRAPRRPPAGYRPPVRGKPA